MQTETDWFFWIVALALLFLMLSCAPVRAQHQLEPVQHRQPPFLPPNVGCGDDLRAMEQELYAKYGEVEVANGLQANTQIVKLYVSETGTFTVITLDAIGVACVRAAGKYWTEVRVPPTGGPEHINQAGE